MDDSLRKEIRLEFLQEFNSVYEALWQEDYKFQEINTKLSAITEILAKLLESYTQVDNKSFKEDNQVG